MTPTDIILDTNVVLDWLVFEHPPGCRIGEDIVSGRLRWIGSEGMREELVDVLGRLLTQADLQRWSHRHPWAMDMALRWQCPVPSPAPLPHPMRLRCTDPDDQIFIDLALSRHTPWLVSRDRALLRLGRRARLHGVEVVTPEQWLARRPIEHPPFDGSLAASA